MEKIDVLYIEDNLYDIELTTREFNKNGDQFSLKIISDGEEALNYLLFVQKTDAANLPKIILLDLRLPKFNGLEILEELNKTGTFSGSLVIIVTTSKEEPDLVDAYNFGVSSYILKPFSYKTF